TGVSADEVVNVIITVTVGDSYIGKLAPKSAFWDAQFTHGIINGRQEGTEWLLHADLWDYWDVTASSGPDAPVVTYKFDITNPTTTNAGIEVSDGATANAEVKLDETDDNARSKVNTGTNVLLTVTRYVNGVIYNQSDIPAFNVIFSNPVKAIETKSPYRELTDKENTTDNTSKIDLRRLFSIDDFNGTVLYDFDDDPSTDVMDWTRTQNYGVVGYQSDFSLDANTVEPVGAYNGKISSIAGQTPITLNSGASFTVVGNDAVWTNNGAHLQQPITL